MVSLKASQLIFRLNSSELTSQLPERTACSWTFVMEQVKHKKGGLRRLRNPLEE